MNHVVTWIALINRSPCTSTTFVQSILFLIAVAEFKDDVYAEKGEDRAFEAYIGLINEYIKDDSPSEVNINSSAKLLILRHIQRSAFMKLERVNIRFTACTFFVSNSDGASRDALRGVNTPTTLYHRSTLCIGSLATVGRNFTEQATETTFLQHVSVPRTADRPSPDPVCL